MTAKVQTQKTEKIQKNAKIFFFCFFQAIRSERHLDHGFNAQIPAPAVIRSNRQEGSISKLKISFGLRVGPLLAGQP
jgi:hypothetical protein